MRRSRVLDGRVGQALTERERHALRQVGVPGAVLAAAAGCRTRAAGRRAARTRSAGGPTARSEPEHQLRDRLPAEHAGVGGPDDRRGVHGADGGSTCGLLAITTTTSGLPVCGERVEQGDLPADQLEGRRRPALAHQLDAVADHRDDDVGRPSPRPPPRRSAPRRARPGARPAGAAGRRGRTRPRGRCRAVRMSAPRACVTVQPSGTWLRKPSRTVCVISRGWPSGSQSAWPEEPAQSPSWVCWSSALGPTTAIVFFVVGERERPVVGAAGRASAGPARG